jgi:hypothetical protein
MTHSPAAPEQGRSLTIHVPIMTRKRGGRRLVLTPAGPRKDQLTCRIDNTMVRALARAYRWKRLIEGGRYASVADLAKVEEVNQSYLCRILRLTLLAPDLVEAILDGRQPALLQLDTLLKPLPVGWETQRELFCG